MPSVRFPLALLFVVAASACGSRGCGRSRPATSTASSPHAPRGGAAGADEDGGERVASPVTPRDRLPGMMVPVPVRWIFLREDPVPTGHAPNMIVGALVPCGYSPAIALAEGWEGTVVLRVAARWAGSGPPPAQPTTSCANPTQFVDFVTPERIRLGNYRVTDAVTPLDAGAPLVALRVIEDDGRTPHVPARRVRACTPGRDATCSAGGVCGALRGRADEGVCVPPLDPFLHAGRACERGWVEVALAHPEPYAAEPAPPPGALRACLPECAPGAVETGLACAQFGAQWAWVPASDAMASAR